MQLDVTSATRCAASGLVLDAGLLSAAPVEAQEMPVKKVEFAGTMGFRYGGIKYFLTDWLNLRIEARMFGTRTGLSHDTWWCGVLVCGSTSASQWFWQNSFTGGVALAF